MKAKFITTKKHELLTFEECLEKEGVYRFEGDIIKSQHLVVILNGEFPVYFGLYKNGSVFSFEDDRQSQERRYRRLGEVDLTVKVMEDCSA